MVIVTHDRGIARLADLRINLMDGRVAKMTTLGPVERAAAVEPDQKLNVRREAARRKRRRG